MKNIQLLNKIAKVGTDIFDRAEYAVGAEITNPDAIMVRSAAMHDMEFGDNLQAIARCGAGVNNIPIDRCSDAGIVVFNTPGANANGVKELAIAAILLASRDIVGGIDFARGLKGTEGVAKAVEAGKSTFAGNEILGKKLGVIGLGAIGGMVANAAATLGMKVMGCDPYLTVEAAWNINHSVQKAATFEDIFKNSDYITLHVPATKETKNMINAETIAMMQDGVKIINLSRADLVDATAIKAALESGKVSAYVTDFPTEEVVDVKGIVAIPHLGASTAESEDNCAVMAAHQLDDFLKTGNIKNSVNFPAISMPHTPGCKRICIFHKNIPAVLAQISGAFSEQNINIENLLNRSKGDNAYTLVETTEVTDAIIEKLNAIDGMIKIRVI
ncbi:MAG: phosphoglycerate dehydrogenase [Clostridia bacterium]|nr:phosphoglycerate dehydrogenase [Clostridia bacterium]